MKFVQRGLGAESPWDDLKGGIFLGDEEFVAGFSSQLAARRADSEHPHLQRTADRPSLRDILTNTRSDSLRLQQMRQARDKWGYQIAEIAEHLKLHRNTVSRLIRRAAHPEEPR